MPVKTLTPDEHDRIIELKLARATRMAISREVGCAPATVDAHWHQYLAETADARQGRLEQMRSETIARFEQVATDARHGAILARSQRNHQAAARYLAVEQAALRDIAKLTGVDLPIKVEHTVELVEGSEQEQAIAVVRHLRAIGGAA